MIKTTTKSLCDEMSRDKQSVRLFALALYCTKQTAAKSLQCYGNSEFLHFQCHQSLPSCRNGGNRRSAIPVCPQRAYSLNSNNFTVRGNEIRWNKRTLHAKCLPQSIYIVSYQPHLPFRALLHYFKDLVVRDLRLKRLRSIHQSSVRNRGCGRGIQASANVESGDGSSDVKHLHLGSSDTLKIWPDIWAPTCPKIATLEYAFFGACSHGCYPKGNTNL